jgi:hypothetical protein
MSVDPKVRLWRGRRRLSRVTVGIASGAAVAAAGLAGVFAAGTGQTATHVTKDAHSSDDESQPHSEDGSSDRHDDGRLAPPAQAPTSSSHGSPPTAHTGAS